MNRRTIESVARVLREAETVVATTGAGISAESGVPTFRGADGLWQHYRAEDLATPEAFARDPGIVWAWYRWRRGLMRNAQPNAGHLVLARLEARVPSFLVITQNVDGLHRRAGSHNLIELHGNIWRARCASGCGAPIVEDEGATSDAEGLPRCVCGALLRPDVVWFGEALAAGSIDAAVAAVWRADVLLVVGTSSVVYPAAGLPDVAKRAGAVVVDINIDDTPLTSFADFVLRGPSGQVLPAVEACL